MNALGQVSRPPPPTATSRPRVAFSRPGPELPMMVAGTPRQRRPALPPGPGLPAVIAETALRRAPLSSVTVSRTE